jgi:ABC-type molybdate transport system substrate-binding protein
LRPWLAAALLLLAAVLGVAALSTGPFAGGEAYVVRIYADRTLQVPLEAVVGEFVESMRARGVEVRVDYVYGSSGFALSQLEIAGSGDLYVADGMHYALLGVEKGVLDPGSLEAIGVVRLALVVAEGNPKGIMGLMDALERGDVRVAVGNPEHVTAGVLAWSLFRELGIEDYVWSLVSQGRVVLADSAFQAANLVKLGVVDAAITFNVYLALYPDELDEVYDPAVASVRDYVVVALPASRGPLAEELYMFVLERREVFYRFGVEPADGG